MKSKLVLLSTDVERLSQLMASLPYDAFPGWEALDAEIVEPQDIPATVVTMNSTIRFQIESTTKYFYLKLVYPHEVDVNGTTVSILEPVGNALLGLSQGDIIDWPKPGGGILRVRVESLDHPPERSDESYRRALLLPVFKWPRSQKEGS